jgi:hypothetical protein
MPSPFIPESEDNFDQRSTNEGWKDENDETMLQNT